MRCANSITTCMSCSTMRMVKFLAMRRTKAMVSWVSTVLMGEIGGELVGLVAQADRFEHRLRLFHRVVERAVMPEQAPAVPARLAGNADVLEGRGVGQDVGDLVGARDALLRDAIG